MIVKNAGDMRRKPGHLVEENNSVFPIDHYTVWTLTCSYKHQLRKTASESVPSHMKLSKLALISIQLQWQLQHVKINWDNNWGIKQKHEFWMRIYYSQQFTIQITLHDARLSPEHGWYSEHWHNNMTQNRGMHSERIISICFLFCYFFQHIFVYFQGLVEPSIDLAD